MTCLKKEQKFSRLTLRLNLLKLIIIYRRFKQSLLHLGLPDTEAFSSK